MKLIQNETKSGIEVSLKEADHDQLTIRNSKYLKTRIGMDIRRCQQVDIEGCEITYGWPLTEQYAYGMRLGYSGKPEDVNKLVRISNTHISGFGPANAGYNLNRDGIAAEGGEGQLWMKDSSVRGATDGAVDCKLPILHAKRCTFADTYRLVRLWGATKAIFSECHFSGALGAHFWIHSAAQVTLYNCTFDVPMKVSAEAITEAQARTQIKVVTTDPLTDPWFLTSDEQIALLLKQVAELGQRVKILEDWRKS